MTSTERVTAMAITSMLTSGEGEVQSSNVALAILSSGSYNGRLPWWRGCTCNEVLPEVDRDQAEIAVAACKEVLRIKKNTILAEDAAYRVLSKNKLYKKLINDKSNDKIIIAQLMAQNSLIEKGNRLNIFNKAQLCCSPTNSNHDVIGSKSNISEKVRKSPFSVICAANNSIIDDDEEDQLWIVASAAVAAVTSIVAFYNRYKYAEDVSRSILFVYLKEIFKDDSFDLVAKRVAKQAAKIAIYGVKNFEEIRKIEEKIVDFISGFIYIDEEYDVSNRPFNCFQAFQALSPNIVEDEDSDETSDSDKDDDGSALAYPLYDGDDIIRNKNVIATYHENRRIYPNIVDSADEECPYQTAASFSSSVTSTSSKNGKERLDNTKYHSVGVDSFKTCTYVYSLDSFDNYKNVNLSGQIKNRHFNDDNSLGYGNAVEAIIDGSNQTILMVRPKPIDEECSVDLVMDDNKQIIILASSQPFLIPNPVEPSLIKKRKIFSKGKKIFKVLSRHSCKDEFEIMKVTSLGLGN